jgi:hypothetical protein
MQLLLPRKQTPAQILLLKQFLPFYPLLRRHHNLHQHPSFEQHARVHLQEVVAEEGGQDAHVRVHAHPQHILLAQEVVEAAHAEVCEPDQVAQVVAVALPWAVSD